MNNTPDNGKQADPDPADAAQRLEQDIEEIRDNLTDLAGELDHRRHNAFNIGLQLRRHPVPVAVGAIVVVGLVAGAILRKRSRQHRLGFAAERLQSLRHMWSQMGSGVRSSSSRAQKANRAQTPPILSRIAMAVVVGALPVLSRRVAERFLADPKRPSK